MKRKIFCAIVVILTLFVNMFIIFKGANIYPGTITIKINLEADTAADIQLFYSDGIFDLDHTVTQSYTVPGKKQELIFDIPSNYTAWRLDYGEIQGEVRLYSMQLEAGKYIQQVDLDSMVKADNHDISDVLCDTEGCRLVINGEDPYSIMDMEAVPRNKLLNRSSGNKTVVAKFIVCILLDFFIILFLIKHTTILDVCNEIYGQRELVFNLAKNDFKTRYVGSYLGIVWAFIRPVITVVVYWFVFQVGMRSSDVNHFPFVLWLIAGLVPWFYFSDALGSGTNSLIEYQYLVKKIVFNINTLPIVKIISALIVHAAFVIFTIIIYWCYGYAPDLYTFQLIYYSFCMAVFTLALVYFTSSAVIFFRDITQIIGVILEVGIWITPIMWQLTVIPDFLRWIFKLNPIYYIVSGYRDSLIAKVWFWDNLYLTAYFWGLTVILFILGTRVFNKLKIHFADVL